MRLKVRYRDPGPFAREGQRRVASDAIAAARYQSDLAVQHAGH
jgi:hypothetical protein